MSEWAPGAKIIHIDIDPAEISKNRAAHIGIAGQAAPALAAARPTRPCPSATTRARRAAWVDQIAAWKRQHPYQVDEDAGVIQPQNVVQSIYRITRGEAIICTDVGQHQMWAAQHYLFDRPRRWITSGGLGTMGFGLPAALGAQVALPDELVVVISGDGSFEMTLQELSTAQMYGLPVKVVILNNGYLGMVRQWQELFWEGRYAGSSYGPSSRASPASPRPTASTRPTVHAPGELDEALAEAFAADGPALVDVHVNPMAKVFPMVPSGKGPDAIIVGNPRAGARLVELGDADAGADGLGVEVHLLLELRRHLGRQADLELAVLGLVGLVVGGEVGDREAEHLVGVRVEVDRQALVVGDRRGVVVAAVDLPVGVGRGVVVGVRGRQRDLLLL